MQKKKTRMYDGGESVLHVKNSSGGFYKIKKTGRLEKTVSIFQIVSARNMVNGVIQRIVRSTKK